MSGAHPARPVTDAEQLVDPAVADIAGRVVAEVRSGRAVPGVGESALMHLVRSTATGLGIALGTADAVAVAGRVGAELWGLGPLEGLLLAPGVTDVLVNGPGEIWVDDGTGLRRAGCRLSSEVEVRALAVRLAAAAGRRLDEAAPWVDARLAGGVRLHAVLPPVSPAGTVISLRISGHRHLGLAELSAAGTVPPGWEPVLRAMVRHRAAFLVSGGTGAGKTTLLSALLSAAPPEERMVLVEDVGELWPEHPHVVRLEARHANVEGRGEVTQADLVRQALRMRPDRIVVGECRGPEVRDLLAALNTGHSGGCGTVHANAAADVPARLVALASAAGMTPETLALQAATALHAVVHIERTGTDRLVSEIALVGGARRGELQLQSALCLRRGPGPGWPLLAARIGLDPALPAGPGRPVGAAPPLPLGERSHR